MLADCALYSRTRARDAGVSNTTIPKSKQRNRNDRENYRGIITLLSSVLKLLQKHYKRKLLSHLSISDEHHGFRPNRCNTYIHNNANSWKSN